MTPELLLVVETKEEELEDALEDLHQSDESDKNDGTTKTESKDIVVSESSSMGLLTGGDGGDGGGKGTSSYLYHFYMKDD